MNTRYFYHPDKNLVATLDHVEGDLYRVEVWRMLLECGTIQRLCSKPQSKGRMHVVNETMLKQAAFEQLGEFLEYDPELAAHHDGELELELGHSGGG